MAKIITTIKAVATRIIFSAHSFIAVWQVTQNKKNPIYWSLCGPIGLLFLEGVFTLAIKRNQEWRWFCPSVFLYLGSVVPAIWLLELEKVQQRATVEKQAFNLTALGADLKNLDKFLGVKFKIPDIHVDAQTWTTLIEQFLMLILIIGRWMLPKGDLTRDQLSQLLLVYIGTAADIIEFFDSYKDESISNEPLLVYLTLGIWSWSLLQFTIVLSATRARKPRGSGGYRYDEPNLCCNGCCCSIDVWGIALNVILQDVPFLTFRLLIIIHYKIINYMNVFFTCKNTLVILLQLYRLYVVNAEYCKTNRENQRYRKRKHKNIRRIYNEENEYANRDIYIVSSDKYDGRKHRRMSHDKNNRRKRAKSQDLQQRHKTKTVRDPGYSTGSSQNLNAKRNKYKNPEHRSKSKNEKTKYKNDSSELDTESEREIRKHSDKKEKINNKYDKRKKVQKKENSFDTVEEEDECSDDGSEYVNVINEKTSKNLKKRKDLVTSSSSYSS